MCFNLNSCNRPCGCGLFSLFCGGRCGNGGNVSGCGYYRNGGYAFRGFLGEGYPVRTAYGYGYGYEYGYGGCPCSHAGGGDRSNYGWTGSGWSAGYGVGGR